MRLNLHLLKRVCFFTKHSQIKLDRAREVLRRYRSFFQGRFLFCSSICALCGAVSGILCNIQPLWSGKAYLNTERVMAQFRFHIDMHTIFFVQRKSGRFNCLHFKAWTSVMCEQIVMRKPMSDRHKSSIAGANTRSLMFPTINCKTGCHFRETRALF